MNLVGRIDEHVGSPIDARLLRLTCRCRGGEEVQRLVGNHHVHVEGSVDAIRGGRHSQAHTERRSNGAITPRTRVTRTRKPARTRT